MLDTLEDDIGGVDRHIDAQLLEDDFVPGFADAGDGAGHVEAVLTHLAGHQVVLVLAGDGNQHIGAAGAALGLDGRFTGVAPETDAAQFFVDLIADCGILVDDQHLMPLAQ